MRYFRKELISTPLYLSTGGKFPFDNIGGDEGLWATEDQNLIREAEAAISRGIGGISEIRQQEYEELIKKKIGGPLPSNFLFDPSSQPNPQISALPPFKEIAPRPAAEEASKIGEPAQPAIHDRSETPEPVKVPTKKDFKRPKTGKFFTEASV